MSKKKQANQPPPAEEDEEPPEEEVREGLPQYMSTFADLMALLLCFFVLLLSFAEIDAEKYKQLSGSLKSAFGVQSQIEADQIPKAESIVKQEFTPGKPEPTILETVRQQTSDETKRIPRDPDESSAEMIERIRERLDQEIKAEALELLVTEDGVMIRVQDRDAFPSGSARLQPAFVPILDKLVDVLNDMQGSIVVSGHTDNVPIDTPAFPSNWVLSSARAASVVHHFAKADLAGPERIEIRAYADTRPIASNDTPDERARNRRVEINVNVDGAP